MAMLSVKLNPAAGASQGRPQSAIASYVWGPDLGSQPFARRDWQAAGGVRGLILANYFTGANGDGLHAPGMDAMGNVTSATRLGVASTYGGPYFRSEFVYDYDAFGKEMRSSTLVAGLNPDSFPFHYSTKFTDPESGFNYYGYRFYDPANGRWLNRDPMGERASKNLFAFLDNNPVGPVDILGLISPDRLEEIQRGTGKPYDESKNPGDYNCAGLACGTHKNMTEEETDKELSKLKEIDCNTPCCKKTVKWTFTKQQRTVNGKTGETLDEKDPSDDWHVSSKAPDGQYYHKYGAGPVMGANGEDDFKPGFDPPTSTGNIHSRQKVIRACLHWLKFA